MWETLVLHHSKDHRTEREIAPYFQWKTCQRSIYIGDQRQPGIRGGMPGHETWHGYGAYAFLLEVVTGVRSSLFAETEVLHQFKTRFSKENLPAAPFGDYLARLREDLISDAKYIRRNYLQNLGDQSYGGIAHRLMGSRKRVVLIGSGQLAEKVLPFLKKGGRQVTVAARNPLRCAELAARYHCKTLSLQGLGEQQIENLVIAAPISVAKILPRVVPQGAVIDLRDDDCRDPVPEGLDYHSFREILEALDRTRERHELLRKQLERVMGELVDQRRMARFELVHGWEDIPSIAV